MRGAVSAESVEIVANEPVAPEHYVLAIEAPGIAAAARPGQFAMLRVSGAYDPLLPRAFSFYRADPAAGRAEFLYRVIGKGTRLLAAQRPGAALHIWGPLGRGFDHPAGDAILIGGGVGVPPLVYLAECARREGLEMAGMRACFGFATAAFVVGAEPLAAAGVPLSIATDDGTRGHHGFVTDLLHQELSEGGGRKAGFDEDGSSAFRLPPSALRPPPTVFACGPHAMLAAVARLCEEAGLASQLALEAPMACGVGACIGCTVPRRAGGYARVCTDGPVFRAEEIAWDAS
jgi:dihydroorotate dehydrogenase electron transfer subunit